MSTSRLNSPSNARCRMRRRLSLQYSVEPLRVSVRHGAASAAFSHTHWLARSVHQGLQCSGVLQAASSRPHQPLRQSFEVVLQLEPVSSPWKPLRNFADRPPIGGLVYGWILWDKSSCRAWRSTSSMEVLQKMPPVLASSSAWPVSLPVILCFRCNLSTSYSCIQ